jgi:hypothetical protein
MIPSFDAIKAYVIVGAIIGAGLAGATGAWKVQNWRHDAMEKERIEAAQETARLRARVADTASVSHEDFKEKERVVYQVITQTVDKIIERPVYRNVCLDADGLRSLNDAIRGSNTGTSKPAPAVSRPN